MIVASVVLAFVVAAVVHEAGHWAAARSLGYPARVVVTRYGPGTMWGSDDRVSPHEDRLIVVCAGPGASCVAGLLLFAAGVPWWPIVVLVGVVQLVPFPRSDGRAAWQALRGNERRTS